MAKIKELQKEIRDKSVTDLQALIIEKEELLRSERFKDKFSRKAGQIREAKRQIARAHTELTARATTSNS